MTDVAKLVELEDGDLLALVPDGTGLLRVRATPSQMRGLATLLHSQSTPQDATAQPTPPPARPRQTRRQLIWQWLLGDMFSA